MINVRCIQCKQEGCTNLANWGYSSGKPMYCECHKLVDMMHLTGKRCRQEGCMKRPSYGMEVGKPIFCIDHKSESMFYVKNKTCSFQHCRKQPSYGFENGKPMSCSEHKQDGMIDVISKRCQYKDCTIKPTFGYQLKKPMFCVTHKSEDMISVKQNVCQHDKCKRQPSFGSEIGKPLFCAEHRLEDMFNVIHKRCSREGCKKSPYYGFEPGKALYCASHKLHGMIDAKSKRCSHEGCDKIPTFGDPKSKDAKYCFAHKLENMVDIIHKKCLSSWCDIRSSNPKYRGYCLRCFINLFPDEKISRNYKVKEQVVMDHLRDAFADVDFITDKRVKGGCSMRRPDVLIDMQRYWIILEVDESQHDSYGGCSCENKRLVMIWQDLNKEREEGSYLPIIIIRFNPDSYVDGKGQKVPSCFSMHPKLGVPYISSGKKQEWQRRLCLLDKVLSERMSCELPSKNIDIEHLFYDGFFAME